MSKTIIEEVHEWATSQGVILTIEMVGAIIERGSQAILKEALKYRDIADKATYLSRMHIEEEKGDELILRNLASDKMSTH